jgi:ketosteroid isomerase-like protein
MTVEQIANRLVERCRKGEYETCHHELFAPDAESVEATGDTVKGLENIGKKAAQWCAEHDVHGGTVSDPIVADPFFALKMTIDVTHKPSGQRFNMGELCMYTVRNGTITREQFYYDCGQ